MDARSNVLGGTHDAALDRAPEEIEERRAVLHHHQHPVARLEAERQQRVARAIHALRELGVGDVLAERADRQLGAAAFADVAIDEGDGDIERWRQDDLRLVAIHLD